MAQQVMMRLRLNCCQFERVLCQEYSYIDREHLEVLQEHIGALEGHTGVRVEHLGERFHCLVNILTNYLVSRYDHLVVVSCVLIEGEEILWYRCLCLHLAPLIVPIIHLGKVTHHLNHVLLDLTSSNINYIVYNVCGQNG